MGAVPALFTDSYVVVGSPAAALQTVVCTVRGVTTSLPGQSVKLRGWACLTPASDATQVGVGIIAGEDTATDAAIFATSGIVASSDTLGQVIFVEGETAPATIAGGVFSLTLILADATTPSTVIACHLEARVD